MYDIVFISYNELNADINFFKLKNRFPTIKRVHGVKGIHQAHIEAAKKCFSKMFWVVDGDAVVLDSFKFNYIVPEWDMDVVHVWRSQNPVNGLEYGYGGIKLLPKKLTIDMDITNIDMTTSISNKFKAMDDVSNITLFNTDPFTTWRSAFRECVKLSSKVINGQVNIDSEERLKAWCTLNDTVPYGFYAYSGALAGQQYGQENTANTAALSLINNFDWLEQQFNLLQVR